MALTRASKPKAGVLLTDECKVILLHGIYLIWISNYSSSMYVGYEVSCNTIISLLQIDTVYLDRAGEYLQCNETAGTKTTYPFHTRTLIPFPFQLSVR